MHKGDRVRVKAIVRTTYSPEPVEEILHEPQGSYKAKRLVRFELDQPFEGVIIGYSFRQTGHRSESNGLFWLREDMRHKVWLVENTDSDRWLEPFACLEEDLELATAVCGCGRADGTVKRRRLNTAYADEEKNWVTCCQSCYDEMFDYYEERWGRLLGKCHIAMTDDILFCDELEHYQTHGPDLTNPLVQLVNDVPAFSLEVINRVMRNELTIAEANEILDKQEFKE